jgi:hypothetical protein
VAIALPAVMRPVSTNDLETETDGSNGNKLENAPLSLRTFSATRPLEVILENHPLECCLWSEMEEKSHFEPRTTEVTEKLDLGGGLKFYSRLVLDYDFSIDHHVENLSGEWFAAKVDHDSHLAVHLMPFPDKVALHREAINQLAIAEAQLVVNFVKTPDNGTRGLRAKERSLVVAHATNLCA